MNLIFCFLVSRAQSCVVQKQSFLRSDARTASRMSNDAGAITEFFEAVSLGAPENSAGFVLWRVTHRYVREIDRALGALDLTHLQFETLIMAAWLSRTGEEVTQADISRFGDVQPMQVSHMLKTLEIKGSITRTRSTSDVRAKRVEVTAAGLTVLRRALPVVMEIQRRFFGQEGAVGGSLLTALLRLDRRHANDATRAQST